MKSVRYWAREGGKPICLVLNDDLYETMTRVYREEAAAHGRTVMRQHEIALGGQLAITRSDEETGEVARRCRMVLGHLGRAIWSGRARDVYWRCRYGDAQGRVRADQARYRRAVFFWATDCFPMKR